MPGMQFEAKTVPADLTVNLGKAPDQTARIFQDELHNVLRVVGSCSVQLHSLATLSGLMRFKLMTAMVASS